MKDISQKEITNYLQENYPEYLASNFDVGKIGLQFGSNNKIIKKVMICLDATNDVIDKSLKLSCDLIISHHPFMFNPLISLNYDSVLGIKLLKVFDNRLNIYSMHTNFDVANEGMNDILAEKLKLNNIAIEKEVVDESTFIRVGYIEETTLNSFVKYVSEKLEEDCIKFIGDPNKQIKKVGIVGGAGIGDFRTAIKLGCDCFITGEIKHNIALDAIDNGISLIEVSHSVEALFKKPLKEKLCKVFPTVEFIVYDGKENPFKYYEK